MLYDVKIDGQVVKSIQLTDNLSNNKLRDRFRRVGNSVLTGKQLYINFEKMKNSKKYIVTSGKSGDLLFSVELRQSVWQKIIGWFK